jgi:3-oxoadipate enol-lactonase
MGGWGNERMGAEGSNVIDVGAGPTLVLIPGIQGRWEWMRPTVQALSRYFRVLTFSLAGDPGSGQRLEPRLGFDTFIVQIDRLLEEAGVDRAALCGVSYGGLIALRYTAKRPRRVRELVLASALPPDYLPDERYRFYRRRPSLLLPVFLVESLRRVAPELRAAFPLWRDRARFGAAQAWRVLGAPPSPRRMRDRMELLTSVDFEADARQVHVRSLVITGMDGLDRTVPTELTRRYLDRILSAEIAVLEKTGHLGTVTRAEAFAALVADFVARTEGRDTTAARQQKAG